MDTKTLEKFCPWARVELIDAVHLRCVRYALDDAGRTAHPADADVVNGAVLTPAEKIQRQALYERIERLNEERDGKGYAAFCEQQAYSWFNRFAAIRFMECHGFLSNGVRIFSNAEGAFEPDCLRMASELNLPGLDTGEVLDLMAAGDDGELFRRIIVAQCNELAECLPTVFDHVDDAYALTLPDNLLGKGEHDVLFHLVTDIDESVWNPTGEELNVEVLGWMYQFYNSELKDNFFKSKRKAAVEDLAPATQLFTPDWIVRYMVENSLGRLWMFNNPGSRLRERMDYYIEPDEGHEDFIRVNGPEDITFCDPACGSGHILVYAFSLLFDMYLERGYREREIPELILTRNLTSFEIDERAAQIASLALALCARAHDRRFFSRGVTADIRVLGNIEIDVDALAPASALHERPKLIEALAHLSEVGSLLHPSPEDMGALEAELTHDLSGDLFASHTQDNIERAAETCEALARTFDVVVANPPYMGSKSFNPFMSNWTKRNYPDFTSDLFAAFISRISSFCSEHGEVGIMSPFVWMFIGSYEKLRNKIIDEKTLTSLIQLEYSGFSGATVPICTFTYHNSHLDGYKGGYVRLSDFVGAAVQAPKTLEAIQNPNCGWFYRADAATFHDIPGSPIAYWTSRAFRDSFTHGSSITDYSDFTGSQNKTGDNETYLRYVWEIPSSRIGKARDWTFYAKGGQYRRWYGNIRHIIDIRPEAMKFYRENPTSNCLAEKYWFTKGICYTTLTSGKSSFRLLPARGGFDMTGPAICGLQDNLNWCLAFLNSSVASEMLGMLNPTLALQVKDIKNLPLLIDGQTKGEINQLTESCIFLSQADWDTQETSWDFKRNPLI